MSLSTVRRYDTVGEAEAARSALDAARIAARVDDENLVSVQWLYAQAVGGVKIRVKAEDREEAEQLLSEAAVEVSSDDAMVQPDVAKEEDDTLRCPACGGTDIQSIPRLTLFAMLSVLICGIGVAVSQPALAFAGVVAVGLAVLFVDRDRCRTCGERWTSRNEDALDAPPPEPSDTAGMLCPRCGNPDLHKIRYRQFKAIALIFSPLIFLVLPIWFFLPKKKCEHCAARTWW